MAEALSDLVNSIQGLGLIDVTTHPSDSTARASGPYQDLAKATEALIGSVKATLADAQRVLSAENARSPGGQHGTHLIGLRRSIDVLTRVAENFSGAVDNCLVQHLTPPDEMGAKHSLLSHFYGEVKVIARDVLNNNNIDDKSIPREILERCYDQVVQISGTLRADNYYAPLAEAQLGWPYDAEFEAEEYYEHEDRLELDEDYARDFQRRCLRKIENKQRKEEEWAGFWVRALSRCLGGPTLFYPPAGRLPECRLTDVPRYLFRAFDQGSSGLTDSDVVASIKSIFTPAPRGRVDLLSRPEEEAAKMLYGHLTKPCFRSGETQDNLMSWSSSLLFVVQYAIWRCHQRHRAPHEVKICAVDTRQFPRGQFARDMELLQAYRQSANQHEQMREFFKFRLERADYDNGEFLSQGEVHHAGRSCVFSLGQLVQAGLYDLYPEFADEPAKELWTKRVRELRSAWSTECRHPTTRLEIQNALSLATSCFGAFNAPEMAVLLLSFKNRKLQETSKAHLFPSWVSILEHCSGPKGYGPAEVQRYMAMIAQVVVPTSKRRLSGSNWPTSSNQRFLEEIFDCT